MRSVRLRVAAICLSLAAIIGGCVAAAAPALAAGSGTVTVTYGNWDCTRGGSPVIALMSINQGGEVGWQSGASATTWTLLNTQVQINATLFCKFPWYETYRDYYEYNFNAVRWVSFSGEHIYI